jgi:hypothetical protein
MKWGEELTLISGGTKKFFAMLAKVGSSSILNINI